MKEEQTTQENQEEKKPNNKPGCILIIVIIAIFSFFMIGSDESDESSDESNPMSLSQPALDSMIGHESDSAFWDTYGFPEIVSAGKFTHLYYPDANLSMVVRPGDGVVVYNSLGRGKSAEFIADYTERRTELIEKQFRPFNGSHKKLNEFIKSQLNDPDSYEHLNTTYFDQNEFLIVITEFTAKNIYGGTERHTAKAKANAETGEIIEILDYV